MIILHIAHPYQIPKIELHTKTKIKKFRKLKYKRINIPIIYWQISTEILEPVSDIHCAPSRFRVNNENNGTKRKKGRKSEKRGRRLI